MNSPNPVNPKLKSVVTAYGKVAQKGTKHQFHGEPKVANMVESHVQGIALYGKHYIVTHNNKGYSKGIILVLNSESKKLVHKYYTPDDHYNHPSGLQVIGDYLAMAVENSTYDSSYIRFYDLSELTDTADLDYMPSVYIHREKKGAGGAGITNYTDGGVIYYLLGVIAGGVVDFYISNGGPLNESGFGFGSVPLFQATIDQKNVSGICLLTEAGTEDVYFIGFGKDGTWDQAYLYKVGIRQQTVTKIDMRHMITEHGGVVGDDGVHFRWGSGLRITSDTAIEFFATQRNFVGNNFTTNTFETP